MTDLLELSADFPVIVLAHGEVLIEEGSDPAKLYVLISGPLVIEHGGMAFARIDTPGAVFGEMFAVLDRPATATVRAAGEVHLRIVENPIAFLTEHPGAALAVLRTTASRLDGLTHYLIDVKQQFANLGGHLGVVDQILDRLIHHQGPRATTGSARDPDGDHAHGA